MAYNAKADILGEISEETLMQLTDDDNLGVVNDDKVDSALARSSAQMDGYCSTAHDVPFDPAPAFIRALDLDIAVYNLFSRRENVPENRSERYKNAIKTLEMIAKGTILIGAPKTEPMPTTKNVLTAAGTSSMDARLRNY